MKYYWYISVKPDSNTSTYSIPSYIKRSLSLPINDIFYITEIIEGYKHIIKEKGNENSPYTINDEGKPDTITSIERRIKERLITKWEKLNSDYNEKESKNSNELRERMLEQRSKDMEDAAIFAMENPSILASRRKKLKRKPHIIRRNPCKCNKIIKRKVRK